jgi:general secretion pathway protein N
MKRLGILTVVAGVFAVQAAGLAHPESDGLPLASIGLGSGAPGLQGPGLANAGPPTAEVPKTGNPLWAIPISRLSATRDRPLFSASRHPRPPTVAAAPSPVAAPEPVVAQTPPFILVGTIIGESNRIAIFFDEGSKTATRVREGERASEWTLRTVESRSTVLEGGGRTVTLELPEPTVPESAAPFVSAVPRKQGLMRGKPDGL